MMLSKKHDLPIHCVVAQISTLNSEFSKTGLKLTSLFKTILCALVITHFYETCIADQNCKSLHNQLIHYGFVILSISVLYNI